MRVARHWSICADDAHDAFQRALEIYMRRLDTLDPATEIAWLRVVVKHEALAIRRERSDSLPVDELDFDARAADAQRPVDDVLSGRERVDRSTEALRRIKPDEAKALVLKAQGLSYREIGERLAWTYTKVNRCLTEGRARFLAVYAEIEAGESCARFAPTLAALVGGTATADALLELRPHIRNCAACRATVRELHATRLGRLTALLPIPALVSSLRWLTGRGSDEPAATAASVAPHGSPGGIVIGPGAQGGEVPGLAPLHDVPDLYEEIARLDLPAYQAPEHSHRLLELKTHVYQWLHRFSGSDAATSAQIAATAGGGGRIATVGAVIGLCLSSVGAGTVCVVSGVIENPFASERPTARAVPPYRKRSYPTTTSSESAGPRQHLPSSSAIPSRSEKSSTRKGTSRHVTSSVRRPSGDGGASRTVAAEFHRTQQRSRRIDTAETSIATNTPPRQAPTFEDSVQTQSTIPAPPTDGSPVTDEFGG
jgi:RNA polymerase sigma factor (sigma-70 family)